MKMGSSTKKHKKEKERDSSKKRKHRSRSRSRSPVPETRELREPREKDRRHRKHHRDRKREKVAKYQNYETDDSDVIEVPPAPQISKGNAPTPSPPPPPVVRNRSPERIEQAPSSSASLSVDETNKLRAKLGLKPLDVPDGNKVRTEDGKLKDDLGEFYHAPAKNITNQKRDQKIRDRLAERREKRALEKKLAEVRGLGESESDDDTSAWIKKSRHLQKQKDEAAKREKILEELDAEFGIGELVAEETMDERRKAYNARQLKGLKVEHDVEEFKEGKHIILTLKDQEVLDEGPDALINVNLIDDERYKKSNENKKQKPHLHGYDVFNDSIEPENRKLLGKYDEVIGGQSKTAFTIGEEPDRNQKINEIKAKLNSKRLESLILPALQIASDYYSHEEITFKKPKKKVRKMRQKPKMLKADDLLPLHNEKNLNETEWLKQLGVRRRRTRELQEVVETDDLPEVDEDLTNIRLEPEQDNELEAALRKARRLKNKVPNTVEDSIPIKLEPQEEVQIEGSIVLNSTAEFCRSLGEIPTYGLAGNRDEESDLMDFEVSAPSPPLADDDVESAWNSVPEHLSIQPTVGVSAPILEDEPSIGSGVGGALKLAMSKGYLERDDQNRPSNSRFAHLQAQNYSIEDKTYGGEDDKFGGRRERYAGPTTDFKEKDGFKPNVKLDYIDDDGHVLSAKEAFRYLSHKFHGKGPGKNKVEKRLKKNEQEGLMKKMSSTDTPLGTLGMLQAKQKETNSAFVVLSGSKQSQTTSISKNKR